MRCPYSQVCFGSEHATTLALLPSQNEQARFWEGLSYKCVALLAPNGSITINNNCLHCFFPGSYTARLQTSNLSHTTSAHSSEAPCVGRAPTGRGPVRWAWLPRPCFAVPPQHPLPPSSQTQAMGPAPSALLLLSKGWKWQ